jgi:hypothetical protein
MKHTRDALLAKNSMSLCFYPDAIGTSVLGAVATRKALTASLVKVLDARHHTKQHANDKSAPKLTAIGGT